jgi:hypothetical protein
LCRRERILRGDVSASSSERVLLWIRALAALAVGRYSVGALRTAAGLRGASLSVRDFARGIADADIVRAFQVSLAQMAAFAVEIVVMTRLLPRPERATREATA